MIIIRLSDGLGNQMFQYALGRHLAIKNDTELRIDLSWFKNREVFGGTDRTVSLDAFNVVFTPVSRENLRQVVGSSILGTVFRRYGRFLEGAPRHSAKYFNYYREILGAPEDEKMNWAHRRRFYPDILDAGPDAYLDGYWQTESYFGDIAGVIRDDFTVASPPTGNNADMISEIESTTAVSIHVRRGDQVHQGPDWSEYGNALPETYHRKAARLIGDQVDDPTFFVFSDDPEWAQANLDLSYPTMYVTHNDGSTDYEDIRLMKHCDHHVVANSTFSWWGAWLNDDPNKVVVVPSPWKRFGYPEWIVDDWDLYPENWTVLRY